MRFDGMIFDIEGTLIDCVPQNFALLPGDLVHFRNDRTPRGTAALFRHGR